MTWLLYLHCERLTYFSLFLVFLWKTFYQTKTFLIWKNSGTLISLIPFYHTNISKLLPWERVENILVALSHPRKPAHTYSSLFTKTVKECTKLEIKNDRLSKCFTHRSKVSVSDFLHGTLFFIVYSLCMFAAGNNDWFIIKIPRKSTAKGYKYEKTFD